MVDATIVNKLHTPSGDVGQSVIKAGEQVAGIVVMACALCPGHARLHLFDMM